MSIIQCPECGGPVSNKAEKCIHCGYPIGKSITDSKLYSVTITNIIGKNWEDRSNHRNYVAIALSDRYHIPDVRTFANSTLVNELRDLPKTILTGIPHKYIEIIKQDLEETWCVLRIEEFDGEENTEIDYDAVIKRVERIKAKKRCPKCSSENITTGSRGYSLLWGFLGSGSTVNRCGNCGHTWKP